MCENVPNFMPAHEPRETLPQQERPQNRPPHRPVELRVRLDIPPDNRDDRNQHSPDRFVLTGPDGYQSEKTVADDVIPGDEWLDLHYTGLFEDLSYSLQVIQENREPYYLFQNSPYPEITRMSPTRGTASRPPPEGQGS